MLRGYQVEVVAFILEDVGIIHRHCAEKLTTQLTVDKAERGLTTTYPIAPLSRYELQEILSASAEEWTNQDYDYEDDPVAWQQAYDTNSDVGYACDHCGEEIT